jgi:hypothetical protein
MAKNMNKIFYPTAERLRYLLESIHNRELALPDFQRDFVWEPRATEELIESICQNFPAGSLLRIKNSSDFLFASREFAGAPGLNGHEPSYLVLDGQQRLTSLYQAFYGVGGHRYYITLGGLMDGQDLEDCVFYDQKDRGKKRFGTVAQQAQNLTFPFERLFGDGVSGFDDWLDHVLDERPENDQEKKDLRKRLREVRDQWIRAVEDYEFPMVTLVENTSASAVCTIFETLNRTGMKLSVFDLLVARFRPQDVRLRDLWEEAKSGHPIIADFEVEPYYLLQSISLFTAKAAPSCKRRDVLQMTVEQIQIGWCSIVQGLVEFLQMLRDDCGVILPRWLPYNTILIPGAAAFAAVASMTGPEVGAARNKIKRWFWCSVFAQAYERSPNSQAAKDYVELKRWLDGGDEPQNVAEFDFDIDQLKRTTPRQRAFYRGVIALILKHEARDFHTGKRITGNMILEEKIDDHHVFPQAYVAEHEPNVSAATRDCVLNRTLIDKITNIRIGKRPPSEYLAEIAESIGDDVLEEVLKSHLLPGTKDSPLRCDQFDKFMALRQFVIANKILEVVK